MTLPCTENTKVKYIIDMNATTVTTIRFVYESFLPSLSIVLSRGESHYDYLVFYYPWCENNFQVHVARSQLKRVGLTVGLFPSPELLLLHGS